MSKFKISNFFKFISSLMRSNENNENVVTNSFENDLDNNENQEKKLINRDFIYKPKIESRVNKLDCYPLRQLVLWGWDKENNPSLIIFYGKHEDKIGNYSPEIIWNSLKDEVEYTSYAIYKGKDGHLPSFESVNFAQTYREREYNLYYKKDIEGSHYYISEEAEIVKGFQHLNESNRPKFNYFDEQNYSHYVNGLKEQNIIIEDFKFANNPNEILNLTTEFDEYYELIIEILSNNKLYNRKKKLNKLIEMNPPKNIYKKLIEVGSSEVISGLFIELAKRKNSILIEEAKIIISADIDWVSNSYAKGVRRCINIYINALDDNLRKKREKNIRENLKYMDLHLIKVNNKVVPEDKIIDGAAYRKYSMSGVFNTVDYSYEYNPSTGRYTSKTIEREDFYLPSKYNDGKRLNIIEFKNTIQEAEVYGMADVIGKIAYYLDAPRLTYYFKGTSNTKQLKYLQRYVRRIIDSYAKNDSDKFIEAMKSLLTSYTTHDYLCKFKGNFQFNYFIKNYLYYDFKEKPPTGWDDWSARANWMKNDQLLKLEGRYEAQKEIWDSHINDVIYIAVNSKVDTIRKALYYIIKDACFKEGFVENIEFKTLIDLALTDYEPIANLFKDTLERKIDSLNKFDFNIMLHLMKCSNNKIHKTAIKYMKESKGNFKAKEICELMFLPNIDNWLDLYKESLLSLKDEDYSEFVKSLICLSERFNEENIEPSKEVKEIILMSTNKITNLSKEEKKKLVSELIESLITSSNITLWIEEFIEELIFAVSYNDLHNLLQDIKFNYKNKALSERNMKIISILESIKKNTIPKDSQIVSILETGSSKMINSLLDIIQVNRDDLNNRLSTLLIMIESKITMLNIIAEEVFDKMPNEEQIKLHLMIIDSPVERAYEFGINKLNLIYGDKVPLEFIKEMIEHESKDIKSFVLKKIDKLDSADKDVFIYYMKTVLYMPNKLSKEKDKIYNMIPKFLDKNKESLNIIEDILLDLGSSNIKKDSEKALVTLAKIRGRAINYEG